MKLSDVVNRINGNVDRFTTDLLYYIGGEHFESNELEITKKGLIKENLGVLGFKFHFAFQDRDVLFMARNPHLRKAGMVHFAGLCSDASYILRSKDENVLTQEYLAVMVQSDRFWEYCESHKVGSVNFANNWTSIANYEFELPSIEEQRAIADRVWAAYEVKQSYKNLLEQNDKLLHAQFQKMFGDVDDMYLGQTLYSFEDVCFDDTKSATKIPENAFLKTGKYPIYCQGKDSEVGYTNSSEGLCANVPAILFGDHTREFKLIKEPFFIGADGVKILRPKKNVKYEVEFLFHMLRYRTIPNTGYNRHYKWVKLFEMPVPPIDKQREFVAIAERSEKLRADLEKGITAIEAVIRSLIAEGTAVLG